MRGLRFFGAAVFLVGCFGKTDGNDTNGLAQGQGAGKGSDNAAAPDGGSVAAPPPARPIHEPPVPASESGCSVERAEHGPPDFSGPLLYWTECNVLRVSTLAGQNKFVLAAGLYPMGIAVDAVAGKVYWTDNGSDTVERANLDGTERQILYTAEDRYANPSAIAVDHAANRIFWAEPPAVEHATPATGVIRSAALDGSGQAIAFTAMDPDGVAIDPAASLIYVADNGTDSVARASYGGTTTTALYTNSDKFSNAGSVATNGRASIVFGQVGGVWRMGADGSAPTKIADAGYSDGIAVDPVAQQIYFTDNGSDTITRANYDGSRAEVIHHAHDAFSNPHGIAIKR